MESLEISAAEAQPMIDAAKAYIESVNTSRALGEVDILRGASIPSALWSELVEALGENPKVWAMLALEDGKLKIIFKGKAAEGTEYKYFNFTSPCPANCPD